MTYTPFEPRVLVLMFYYIAIAVFSAVLTVKMHARWKERKVKPPLLLTIVFLVFTAAIVMLAIGLVDSAIATIYREIYRFSLPFGYSMIVVADIVLFMFAIDITGRGKKALNLVIVLGIVLFIILYLPWNWWGVPSTDYAGQLNIRLYSTLGLIAYSYIIYITIARICKLASAEAKTPVAKTGLSLMFWAMICLLLFFLMFVVDTILIVAFDDPGYSIFVYIAWAFAVAFYICMYLSVVMPDWLARRVAKKSTRLGTQNS
nr:hypothetical protein [Candidatus Sigynarchaeota archaeon]